MRQKPSQAYQTITLNKKTRTRLFATIVAKKIITLRPLPNL